MALSELTLIEKGQPTDQGVMERYSLRLGSSAIRQLREIHRTVSQDEAIDILDSLTVQYVT
jgi:hypothetical protein